MSGHKYHQMDHLTFRILPAVINSKSGSNKMFSKLLRLIEFRPNA